MKDFSTYIHLTIFLTKKRLLQWREETFLSMLSTITTLIGLLLYYSILTSNVSQEKYIILFSIGISLFNFGILRSFGTTFFDYFGPEYIASGKLNYILRRPLHPLFSVLIEKWDIWMLSNSLIGGYLIVKSFSVFQPTVLKVILLILLIFLGILASFSTLLILVSLSFYNLKAYNLPNLLTGLEKFSRLPLPLVFPNFVGKFIILFFPIVISGGGTAFIIINPSKLLYAIVGVVAVLVIANKLFSIGIKKYQGV